MDSKRLNKFYIENSTFYCKLFLFSSPTGRFLLSLFAIGEHLHFLLQVGIEANPPSSHITFHITKMPRRPPMLVHDVAGKLPFTIHIMKAPKSLQSAFMKKVARLCRYHNCEMISLECA